MFTQIICTFKLIMLFSFYFTISLISGFILLAVRFILRPFARRRFRFTRTIKRYWLSLTISAFQFYFPMPIYVSYNKEILKKKRTIVISNHLTNWDWLIILVVLNELEMYDDLCIIMKESLRNIPIFGYGMKCFGYIFLKRNWIQDSRILVDGISALKKKTKFNILIFPEGTFLDEDSYMKSRKFARDSQIKIENEMYDPRHSLVPRTTGINKIKEALGDKLDGIIDITMFITPYKRFLTDKYSFEKVFLDQKEKPRFHFIIDEVANTQDENWLYTTFHKKEKLLAELVDLDKNITEISCLAEFTTFINNLLQKKYHVFEAKIRTKYFWLYFLVYIGIIYSILFFIYSTFISK